MKLIDQSLLKKQAERTKKEQTTWHASSLGGCLRGVYFKRLGVKPDKGFDAKTLRIFKMGRLIEDFYRGLLEEQAGLKVENEVYVRDEKELGVSGYADVVVEKDGEKEVLELKSINTNSYNYMTHGSGAKIGHKMQLWIYLHLLGIDIGRIVYIEKNFLRVAEYPVRRDDEKLEGLVRKTLGILNTAWEKQDPSLIPLPKKGSWKNRYCRWHKSHCSKVVEKKKKIKKLIE